MCVSHANMEKLKVETLILSLAKIISPPPNIKSKNILALRSGPMKLAPFQKISLQTKLCWE